MITQEYFSSADFMLDKPITGNIIGLGGIGSWLLMFLESQKQFKTLNLYEYDHIEPKNLGGQLFPITAIGFGKTEAAIDVARLFRGVGTEYVKMGKYTNDRLESVTFAVPDCIDVRRTAFENHTGIFMDARLTAEYYECYCVYDEETREAYKKTLFKKSEAADAPCNYRETSHVAAMCAGDLVALFNRCIAYQKGVNIAPPFKITRSLNPFIYEQVDIGL